MGVLTVRKLDDELVRRLKIRAAQNGVSAEEEHRRILRAALVDAEPADDLVQFFQRSPLRGVDLDGIESRTSSPAIDLE